MSTTHLQRHQIANSPDFIHRLGATLVETALAVLEEGTSGDSDTDNARRGLAQRVLADPAGEARRLAYPAAVIADQTNEELTDAEISAGIAANWTAFSGYNPN